jgi:hypothetical protein
VSITPSRPQHLTFEPGAKVLFGALALTCALLAGCGGSSSPASVSGSVDRTGSSGGSSGGSGSGSGSFRASPEYVQAGGTSTLSWDVPGATSCTASGGWSGSQPASGSFTVGPISATTTYQLSCSGSNGNELSMVTVEVVDKVLRWQAPTQNVDGTPLTDLAGYVIYWGSSSRNYTGSQTINSSTVTQWEATVAPGTYYFAMTAFDAENNESSYSNEVLKIIP